MATAWTAGVVRHGVADPVPPPQRFRAAPERCPEYGHPGITFHPQLDRTWCECGGVVRDGGWVLWEFKHPASPLVEWWDEGARASAIRVATDRYGLPVPDFDKYQTSETDHRQKNLLDLLEGDQP